MKFHPMLDLLKRIFLHRKHWDPYYTDSDLSKLPGVEEVLTIEQRETVYRYYFRNKASIENMMLETTVAVEPSTSEDRNQPPLWKPSYWNWFFNKS